MSTMTEALERGSEGARSAKVEAVRRRDGGTGDLYPTVLSYRGDVLVALVQPVVVDRDAMLAVAGWSAFGFDADVICCTFETFMATEHINPHTGRSWGPGEMQVAVEERGARESGLVVDALMLHSANRAGDAVQRMLPYRVTGRNVEWLPGGSTLSSDDPDTVVSGYVPDVLADIMRKPSLGAAGPAKGHDVGAFARELGIDAERARAHQDAVVAKMLLRPRPDMLAAGFPEQVVVALAAEAGSVREQVIRASAPGARRMRP